MDSFNLDLYTPNGVIVKDLGCEEMFLPTTSGDIHVMPGHTHILSQLASGIMTIKTNSGERHFSVAGGLCKILEDKITILSMTSETAEQIDVERAQSAEHKAASRLHSDEHMSDIEQVKWQRKLDRAKSRIKLGNLGLK